MARKSLSSQIIEEVDRARGLLKPVQDIVDPMTAHMVGAVLESLTRIEGMCLRSMQNVVNAVLEDRSVDQPIVETAADTAPVKRRSTSHKAPRARKVVES